MGALVALGAAPAHATVGDVVADLVDAIFERSCAYPRAEQRILHAVGLPTSVTPCTYLVSLNAFDQSIDKPILAFGMSRDARTLIFNTAATNVLGGPARGGPGHVYVRDVDQEVAHDAGAAVISGGPNHVYVRDLATGDVEVVSRDYLDVPASTSSSFPAISGDGALASFTTAALILDEPLGIFGDAYVRDLAAGTVVRGSFFPNGSRAGGIDPDFSADGRYLAYVSGSVYVRDLVSMTAVPVAVATGTDTPLPGGVDPEISGDGRHVVFSSTSASLVPGDGNGQEDVFAHDRDPDGNGTYDEGNGATALLSRGPFGVLGNSFSLRPAVSDDGRYVVFESWATNLGFTVPGSIRQIYLRDRGAPDANGAFDDDANGATTLVTRNPMGTAGNGDSFRPAISPDGRYVGFISSASNLIDGDTNNATDAFVFDRTTGEISRVSVRSDGTEATSGGVDIVLRSSIAMSEDGRFVAFMNGSPNLADLTPVGAGVFIRDRDITLDF